MDLVDQSRPMPDTRLVRKARWLYAEDERSGRESSLSRTAIAQLGDWDQALRPDTSPLGLVNGIRYNTYRDTLLRRCRDRRPLQWRGQSQGAGGVSERALACSAAQADATQSRAGAT